MQSHHEDNLALYWANMPTQTGVTVETIEVAAKAFKAARLNL